MTAAVAPLPFRGWLDAILSFLPQPAASARLPDPPAELLPLVTMARDALGARDVADLHVRLDSRVMDLRDVLESLPAPAGDAFSKLPSEPPADSIVARTLGPNVARKLLQGMHECGALFLSVRELQEEPGSPRAALVRRALRVRPWSLHDGEVVPHALVESAILQCRGIVAVGALLAACVDARRPEPWLTNALADAFLVTVRESRRLLGAGMDLEALFRDAEEADAAFLTAFERDVEAGASRCDRGPVVVEGTRPGRTHPMSLAEILPSVQSLPRADKLRLIQLLAQELVEAADPSEVGGGASYPGWSIDPDFEAAAKLEEFLRTQERSAG